MSEEAESKASRQAARRRLATLGFFARAGLMGLSFLLSLMLFLYVQSQTAPPVTHDFTVHVQVEPQSNFFCSAEGALVNAKVTGTQAEIAELEQNPEKLGATVRIQRLIQQMPTPPRPVEGYLPVVIRRPAEMEDLSVDLYPASLNVGIEVKKTVLKEVQLRSLDPLGNELSQEQLSKVDVEPSIVSLTGPASLVEKASPRVEVDFNSLGRPESKNVRVFLSDGTLERSVTSDPDKVLIAKVRDQASAYLNVTFVGHPALGYAVTGYQVQPGSTVQLTGAPETIADTRTVDVTVDVSDLKESKTLTVVPKLPEGVKLASTQPITVTVTVERRRR